MRLEFMAKRILTNPGATNIYLPSELKKRAKALAAEKGMSLSGLVQRLIVAEAKRKRGIAHLHDRQIGQVVEAAGMEAVAVN